MSTLCSSPDSLSISQKRELRCVEPANVCFRPEKKSEKKNTISVIKQPPSCLPKNESAIQNWEALFIMGNPPPPRTVSIPFAYRVWRLLILHSMSRWPAEYCSMTSFTSYGRNVSLNFRLATWNFIILFKHILDMIPNNFIKINYQYVYQQISRNS